LGVADKKQSIINQHPTLFITQRGSRHQQAALDAAPGEFMVRMLRSPSKEEIISQLPGKEFLITERSGIIDADVINAGKDLRLIQRLGSQTFDIDLAAARSAGIPVCYLPVRTCINVAEHMLMQILALAKRLREVMDITLEAKDWGHVPQLCDEDYFAYNWSSRQGINTLWESTVGILGLGEIGTELARRLQGFGCTVLYNKRKPLPAFTEQDLNIRFASQEELLAKSDYVCMLMPYFPETAQTLNADFFKHIKQGACFVSCGGSGVVDEKALNEALISGHLSGAAIDTFTWEPIAQNDPLLPLARQPRSNLILTPHTAAGSAAAQSNERSGDYINLTRVITGDKLVFQIA
jgi:phosphoglycerate dehydrogenase-like enzyme